MNQSEYHPKMSRFMRGGFLPLRKGNAGAQAIVRSRIAVRLSGSPHSLRGSAAAEYGCLMTGQENERGASRHL